MNDDDLEAIGVSTPEAREFVQNLMALIEILTDADEKGPHECTVQLNYEVAACDAEYRQHKDTRKHAACLKTAREHYDRCME